VYWPFEDQGSGLVIRGYSEAARALGHEIEVYGIPFDRIPLDYTLELSSADAVVFLFEWTTRLYYGDRLDLLRLISSAPRERRVVIDGDGNYNDVLRVDDDWNHPGTEEARTWVEVCDALADKICQPTLHRSGTMSFLSCSMPTTRGGNGLSTRPPKSSTCCTWAIPSSVGRP
jgi:hypothetical protein